mmetsp:Transcript_21599/g.38120  ORF Transcript_21599/g.38120 Transcript_21599/m.38120 type:complete len:221 (-) Transcript_21599:872-1534(-)
MRPGVPDLWKFPAWEMMATLFVIAVLQLQLEDTESSETGANNVLVGPVPFTDDPKRLGNPMSGRVHRLARAGSLGGAPPLGDVQTKDSVELPWTPLCGEGAPSRTALPIAGEEFRRLGKLLASREPRPSHVLLKAETAEDRHAGSILTRLRQNCRAPAESAESDSTGGRPLIMSRFRVRLLKRPPKELLAVSSSPKVKVPLSSKFSSSCPRLSTNGCRPP